MPEKVQLIKNGSIATILLDNPQSYNALDLSMAEQLAEITDDCRNDKAIRVVLLRGNGKAFMAGGDIRYFQENYERMPQGVLHIIRRVNAAVMNICMMDKPVIACVHGSVAGVGISFMLAADFVLCENGTKFTLAYNRLGVSPDGGASYFLPRAIGYRKAIELITFSELFNADKAYELGLVNWLETSEQLDSRLTTLTTQLATGPRQALAASKKLCQASSYADLAQHLEREAESFSSCTTTRDFSIGINAFIEKKNPEFVGE